MKLLILGGTGFLSRHMAAAALAAGHQVTCASRGVSGRPPAGSRFVRWDRKDAAPAALAGARFDVAVDVLGQPSHVRRALQGLHAGHWIFISTLNVYADPRAGDAAGPDERLVPAIGQDVSIDSPQSYGGMKVGCEQLVAAHAPSFTILRPGLIIGPGDRTGRFSYWPLRLAAAAADGHPFIAPEPRDDPVQFIDARDLADWILLLADGRRQLVCDAVGPVMTRAQFIDRLAATLGPPAPAVCWLSPEQLAAHRIEPWSGPRSLPLWLPAQLTALMDRDHAPARRAGLRVRPVADSARAVLGAGAETAAPTGLSRAEELRILGVPGPGPR